MTVLMACQEAAVELNQALPASVFSTSDEFARELALCANRAAQAITQVYDWETLKTLATITGDASTTAFNLPSDYDRMLKKGKVHSLAWKNSIFSEAKDEDDWLYTKDFNFTGTPGKWIILSGQFQVFPAMPVGETARFYYISNLIVNPTKVKFTADADTFKLSERLLALGIVWRWRAMKRRDYAEDMQNYEIALGEEIGKDKGSKILTIGRQRLSAEIAYPGTITP